MTNNRAYTEEYLSIIESLNGDIAGRRAAHEYMMHSTAIVHNKPVVSSYVPRLFDAETKRFMTDAAETTHTILVKVIEHYLEDETYRDVFDYDPRLVDLICIPRRYDAVLPFMRADIFLNEDDLTFGFCELNADGSSGMNEDRELCNSLHGRAAMEEFSRRHRVNESELFDSWVAEFASIYATFENAVENPRFAICDYLDHSIIEELQVYTGYFEAAGYPCTICDVRKLNYRDGVLHDADGKRIDAIWRRCVTNDVLTFWDESQDLIAAVRDGACALIGAFSGHIVHDKQIFEALSDPRTQALLTDAENAFVREHVPLTRFLDSKACDLDAIRAEKDRWILKPTDNYGATDIFAGCDMDQAAWEAAVDAHADGAAGAPFLVQTYLKPFKTELIEPDPLIDERDDDEVSRTTAFYNNLNGLYLFNGRFMGVFSRLGPKPIISEPEGDLTSATVWVDCD